MQLNPVKVPGVTHMIMLKLHAMKNNIGRELKDLSDIVKILRNSPNAIDDQELNKICLRYGPEEIYAKIKAAL